MECRIAVLVAMLTVIGSAAENARREFGSIDSGPVIPQVAIGENRWSMEFIVASLEQTTQVFTVTFRDATGQPMSVPLEGLGNVSVWADSVPPAGVRTIRTSNTGPLRQGYARVEVSGDSVGSNVAFYAVLTSSEPAGTRPPFRTFVPGMWQLPNRQRLVFNNTGGNISCLAVMSQESVQFDPSRAIKVIARDTNGAELQRLVLSTLERDQHTAFCLPDRLPLTANRIGLLDILESAAVIGFTFDPEGKFHTEAPYSYCHCCPAIAA